MLLSGLTPCCAKYFIAPLATLTPHKLFGASATLPGIHVLTHLKMWILKINVDPQNVYDRVDAS